jgi:Ser/Thr protein kinase RdoA (MazF antagonist)
VAADPTQLPNGGDIPQTFAAITPEWLTGVLGETWLGSARVAAIQCEPLGEGEGFVGQIGRLHLTLDGEAPAAPRSLIAKLPTLIAENRAIGEMLGAYEREILFYRDLAPEVRYRTPRLYYAQMDENPRSRYGPAIVRFVDRLPFLLIRWLTTFFNWAAGKSRRRYLLLMEDLSPARLGDQVAGRSAEQCRPVVENMARCQAALWQDPRLEQHYWVTQLDLGLRITHQTFRSTRPAFEEHFTSQLDAEARAHLDWLDAHAIELARALYAEAPQTLMHGDFRLDNLFFDERPDPLVVDWQGVGRAPGVHDLAYFLSGTLPPHTPPEQEDRLVRAYHDALRAGGVEGYAYEDCLRDYRRALLLGFHRLVTLEWVDLGEERGAELTRHWVDRCIARLRGIDRDALLRRRDA